MNIQISGHGISVTPSMRDHIEHSCSRLTEHFHSITSVRVIVHAPDKHHSYHITGEVHAAKATIFAKADHNDFYTAVDELRHKLIAQLDKHHDILLDRQHHPKDRDSQLDLGDQED